MGIILGIDTGVHTGIAEWNVSYNRFEVIETMPIHRALAFAKELKDNKNNHLQIVFEDARKRRWIPDSRDQRKEAGRRMGAGSVKRDAKIWEDFCTDLRIEYLSVAPRPGLTKWSAKRFKEITGYECHTSEHSRDAAMLVFGMQIIKKDCYV